MAGDGRHAVNATDRVLDALRARGSRVTGSGRQWSATCPAHEDRDPSLSVTRGQDRVLLRCHRDCALGDILAALGLARSDLYDEPGSPNGDRPQIVATYDYTDEAGKLLFQVVRMVPKTFRQRVPDGNGGWTWRLGDTRRTLYHLPDVLKAVRAGETVYVVEGEKDVHALQAVGAAATTNPGGAGKWRPEHTKQLAGAHVVIVQDRDDAGRLHAAQVVAELQGTAASVCLVEPAAGKDVSDHLAAGLPLTGLVDVQPPAPPTHGGTDAAEDATVEAEPPALRLRHAHEAVVKRVHYLWQGLIPLGAATVLPGEEGIGKSTVLARLAADVTRGMLRGDLAGQPRHVLVIAPEDHWEAVVVPRLQEAGADLHLVTSVDAIATVTDEDRAVIIPRDLPAVAKVVDERGTALVWVDSLVTTLPDEIKSTSYKDVAKVLKALGAFAEATGVAVAAPWHLNKSGGSDTALRMMDSRAFRTAVRSVLLMVADPEKPGEGLIALDKANAGTLAVPAVRYRLRSARYVVSEVDTDTGEVVEVPTSCGVADWVGDEAGDGRQLARDLLLPAMAREDDPKAWLREYLAAAGATPQKVVTKAGADAGHGARALQRAAGRIGVVYTTVTTPREGSTPLRQTLWKLPDPHGRDARAGAPATVATVATEPLGGVNWSSSSQVRDGRDGRDGHDGVGEVSRPCRDRVATAETDLCARCGNPTNSLAHKAQCEPWTILGGNPA